jgi:hypothetical protein
LVDAVKVVPAETRIEAEAKLGALKKEAGRSS